MAADWSKYMHDLPEKPETIGIASATGLTIDTVCGKLLRVWAWFDRQTTDGCAPGVTPAFFDSLVAHEGFASAMTAVGWLVQRNRLISIPNFDRHNSKSAKARALAAERMKRSRYDASATESQPDEKRREKNSGSPNPDSSKNPSTEPRKRSRSGFFKQDRTDLTRESLADPALLRRWFDEESRRADGWLGGSPDEWECVQQVAAKVLRDDGIRDPIAVAKWLIRGKHWDYLRLRHEELARLARREAETSPADPIVASLADAFARAA